MVRRIAPSKLNCPVSVPATALTVTVVVRTAEPPYARDSHARAVVVTQAVEPHTSAVVSEVVGVRSTVTKFSPLIVSEPPPPLTAALAEAKLVKAGAAQKRHFATSQAAQRGAAHRTVEAEPPRQCARL